MQAAGLCFYLGLSFPPGLSLDFAPWTCNLMHHSSLVLWNEPGSEMILQLAGGCGQPA